MKESRKCWTEEEDEAIKSYVRRYGFKRWTLISEKMKERFPDEGRSGKQCRERWHNHLSPKINKQPWTDKELKLVFDSHRRLGNRWTQIAQLLQGRTDNAVKNQFYSTLRKGLRRMCKVLGSRNSTTRIKKIKPSVLSALMSNLKNEERESIILEQEIYDLLFSFSSGEKFQQIRQKAVTQAQKQKIQNLLQKILEAKDLPKNKRNRRKSNASSNINNSQQKWSELKDDQNNEENDESSLVSSDEIDEQQPLKVENDRLVEKRQENEGFGNSKMEQPLFELDLEENFIRYEDFNDDFFDLKLKKELSVKKENQERSDSPISSIKNPYLKKNSSSSNQKPILQKQSSIISENQDGFLVNSPRASKGNANFWSRTPKIPTPHIWDNPLPLFTSSTQEITSGTLDKITDRLRQKIADNTSKKML